MTRPVNIDAARLAQMLGPAEPELTCDQCFQELDRYVELELAEADADITIPGMRAHLERLPGLPRGPRQPARLRRAATQGKNSAAGDANRDDTDVSSLTSQTGVHHMSATTVPNACRSARRASPPP